MVCAWYPALILQGEVLPAHDPKDSRVFVRFVQMRDIHKCGARSLCKLSVVWMHDVI